MLVNPTQAKELAVLFLNLSNQKVTKSNMPRTIRAVKDLMSGGVSYEDIKYAVETMLSRKPDIYSFNYIVMGIDDVLDERKKLLAQEEGKKLKRDAEKSLMESLKVTSESEVVQSDETAERNRRKAEGLGIQSRFREKHYFDLFEG